MDHFALRSDSLSKALHTGSLHRNFMGYTASKTQVMVGLGASSISDSWYSFTQNVKGLEEYQHLVNNDIIPIYRGHILTVEDSIIRKHILNLMCQFKTVLNPNDTILNTDLILAKLQEMVDDELVEIKTNVIEVTKKGRPFVRNVCMAFDMHLYRKEPQTRLFSMTV
jgi:oxygen-independent coproporphyrinogen-3 oxidase